MSSQKTVFDLVVNDLGSNSIAKFYRNTKKYVGQSERLLKGIDKAADNVNRSLKNFGAGGATKLSKTLKTVSGQFDSLQGKANRLNRTTNRPAKGGGGGMGIAAMIGGFGGAYLAIDGLKNIMGMGGDMEQTEQSFTTMLGSLTKAKSVIGDLNKFANVTPFTNAEVIKAGRSLTAFGVRGKSLMPTLKNIGDVAAGLKIPFGELSDIYGKIKVGKLVQGEDLNQLAGRGLPIYEALGRVLGVSADKIRKLGAEGQITADHMEQAFENMAGKGGVFFDLMSKQSQTFGGRLSTLMGSLQQKFMLFGKNTLNPFLGKFVDIALRIVDRWKPLGEAITNLFKATGPAFTALGNFASTLFGVNENTDAVAGAMNRMETVVRIITVPIQFLSNAYATIVNRLTDFTKYLRANADTIQFYGGILLTGAAIVGTYTTVMNVAAWATKLWAARQVVLNGVITAFNAIANLNPVGLWVTGILAAVAAVTYAWNKFEGFRSVVFGVWETMKLAGQGIANIFAPIGQIIAAVKEGDWSKAAMAGGKLLLNLTPGAAAMEVGKQFSGDGLAKAWSKGKMRAESGEGTIDFKALTDKFTKPFAAALGGRKQAGSTTTATDEYGSPVAPTTPVTTATGVAPIRQRQAQSGNTGGIHIKFDNLLSLSAEKVLDNYGEMGTSIKKSMAEALLEVVRDVEISYQG